jgi:hypothetical protein
MPGPFKLPVLLGNTKFRDYLYPRMFDGDESGAFNALNPDFSFAMAIAYRVKKWHLSGTFSFADETVSGSVTSDFDVPMLGDVISDPMTPSFVLPNERSIIGPAIIQNAGAVVADAVGYPLFGSKFLRNAGLIASGGTVSVIDSVIGECVTGGWSQIAIYQDQRGDGWGYDPATHLFYPSLSFGAQISGSDSAMGILALKTDPLPPFPPYYWTAEGTLTLVNPSGPNIVLDLMSTNAGIPANYVLTPIEFWPYANSLGQPVYDTITGAQINDPFA